MSNMVVCCVRKCKNRSRQTSETNAKFFSFPPKGGFAYRLAKSRAKRRRLLWLARINREDITAETVQRHMRVCHLHFVSGVPAKASETSDPDWAPSLNLGYSLQPPTADSDVTVKAEPGINDDEACQQADCESTPFISPITVKEEINYDELKEENNCDEVADNVSDEHEFQFAVGQADINELQRAYGELENKCSTLLKEHTELHNKHVELEKELKEYKSHYAKLRDKLTDAEVDKLELNAEISKLKETCDKFRKGTASLQTDTCYQSEQLQSYGQQIRNLKNMLNESEMKNAELVKQLHKAMNWGISLERLKVDDVMVECFTGLPNYASFENILSSIVPHISEVSHLLLHWQCLLLTLMKLKLSFSLQELAERFGVCTATVANIFEKWLYYLHKHFESFIQWPDEEAFQKALPPMDQKTFGNLPVVVLNCVEIFAGKSGTDWRICDDLKQHRSVKFLVGFMFDGTVIYLSKAWEGKFSDNHVFDESGVLGKLPRNGFVLAPRGFPLGKSDGFCCAKLVAINADEMQLCPRPNVIPSTRIRKCQLHVEGVVGGVRKKYTILQSAPPMDFLFTKQSHDVGQFEEMMKVCCALSNLSKKDD